MTMTHILFLTPTVFYMGQVYAVASSNSSSTLVAIFFIVINLLDSCIPDFLKLSLIKFLRLSLVSYAAFIPRPLKFFKPFVKWLWGSDRNFFLKSFLVASFVVNSTYGPYLIIVFLQNYNFVTIITKIYSYSEIKKKSNVLNTQLK